MSTTTVLEISTAQQLFLEGYNIQADTEDNAVPIYYKGQDGEFYHVPRVACPWGKRGEFMKDAPDGLFLTGAAVFVKTHQGIGVAPDERDGGKWKATAQGWATHLEGDDSLQTAMRELHEEVVAFTGRTELVPAGGVPKQTVRSLGILLTEARSVGQLELLRVNENVDERVVEFVYVWDLSEIESLMLTYEEEWFQGGNIGANIHVLSASGDLVGVFSGQQGFVPIVQLALHPVVKQSLAALFAK